MKPATSQKDLFHDSVDRKKMKDRKRISSSFDPDKCGGLQQEYKYQWVILFNWDCDNKNPFDIFRLSLFNDKDIKKEWIENNLGIKSRTTKIKNLSINPSGVYSLFSKIEHGKN